MSYDLNAVGDRDTVLAALHEQAAAARATANSTEADALDPALAFVAASLEKFGAQRYDVLIGCGERDAQAGVDLIVSLTWSPL